MANKRMFSNLITNSDAFIDMPASAQNLYFHLNMNADDDGFIGNPKRIMRIIGCSEDDLKLLILKRFLLSFDDGVVVIKHWRIHNVLKGDRYTQTVYTDELNTLYIKENKAYSLDPDKAFYKKLPNKTTLEPIENCIGTGLEPTWNQTGTNVEPNRNQCGTTGKGLGLDIGLDKEKEKDKKEKVVSKVTLGTTLNDFTTDEDLLNALKDFIEMRKKMRKPLTVRALKQCLKSLDNLTNNTKIKTDIVLQSVEHGWLTFYELKRRRPNQKEYPEWYLNTEQHAASQEEIDAVNEMLRGLGT